MKIIMPLAKCGFDPTEVAVPWLLLTQAGIDVCFATVDGEAGQADPLMLSGEGLDPWGFIPGLKKLKLIGLMLRANKQARAAYSSLEQDASFQNPLRFADLKVADYAGLFLPGGHDPVLRSYYDNKVLQAFTADFFTTLDDQNRHKPIAAICHGVLTAARSQAADGKSVLYGKKTTALTWKLEHSAWLLTKFFARFWDNSYYRTYSERKGEAYGYWGVEQEVTRALAQPEDFLRVEKGIEYFFIKDSGLFRDSANNSSPAWVVEHNNYLSARWPGDAYTLAKRFVALLNGRAASL